MTTAKSLAADLDRVLEQAGDLWADLRGARLFLTGGSGFFGCWLLETLLWADSRLKLGTSVVVLTRHPDAFARRAPHLVAHSAVRLQRGDAQSLEFADTAFSHVVHAGADTTPPASPADRRRVFDSIVEGTKRVLELAREARATRFLLTSSGAVYGRQPSDLTHISEDYGGAPDPLQPASAGAEAKRAAETLCALYADDRLKPTIARAFAFVGPYMPIDAHLAAGNFVRDAVKGGPIRVHGDGAPVRSYMYASDLAVWLWTILLRGEALRPYNVGSEIPVTIGELAHAVARRCSPPSRVETMREPTGQRGRDRYVPATARARNELGLTVTVDLEHALDRTMEWYVDN